MTKQKLSIKEYIIHPGMQKNKRTFWKDIKFKYKVSIINENTLEEVAKLRISKLNGLWVILLASLIIFTVSSLIIIFTPLHYYLPGYVNSELRSQIVNNSIQADSIIKAMDKQMVYIENIKKVMSGNLSIDSINVNDTVTPAYNDSIIPVSEREMEFRKQYEESEKYNLTNVTISQNELLGLNFFTPTRGIVINKFSPETGHFGIDVTAMPESNIISVLDGTVIMTNYTVEFGYSIMVQHTNNIVSIYKHCSRLLKETGDVVKGGEAIGLTVNDKNKNIKHLHFELWHKGKAINPDKYIVF